VSGFLTRRRFLESAGALGLCSALGSYPANPLEIRFRKAHPYEGLFQFIEPGHDEFEIERAAAEIESHLHTLVEKRSLPLAEGFRGISPMPAGYRKIAEGIAAAQYDAADEQFERGLAKWIDSLGSVRSARFFVLPGNRVRYEIASSGPDGLCYRVGIWRQTWAAGKLARHEPVEEILVTAPAPLFEDVTASVFRNAASFSEQMLRGVPYWRARLDPASGIDVYGNNGIVVGDIDGDGWDEVYVCQTGGLPNRLYKNRGDGTMEDITERAGVGVLDNSTSALFLDLRNTGRQDLIVVTSTAPLLFLNEGGVFRHRPDAFRFQSAPQGTFTGIAAADYDLDGRLDLYLCTYIYFQSEDQYRYPVPYYDSRNGPPNFLFHNDLTTDGNGYLNDVTAASGLSENNNRYSFAPAWCDFDGDGWPDLYVANDFGRNNLYKNDRGHFRDIAQAAGVDDVGPGMSAAWFDYDADGRPDLYVSNMWTASGQRVVEDAAFRAAPDDAVREAYRRHARGNSLYRNRGDGTFESTGAGEGVEMGRWAWGSDGIDFDNDGSPEIYITCGMLTNSSRTDLMSFFWRQVVSRSPATNSPAPAYENGWNALNQLIRGDYGWNGREPNVFYVRRSGRYYDFSGVSGLDCADDSRAFAVTDLDGDGNLDILLKSRLAPQVRAFRNNSTGGRHSIAFDLRGTRSNRDAIGARIEVEYAGQRSVKFLQAGSGYLSQHTKHMHFGLGESKVADKITIRWPSGLVQQFENLASGCRYRIEEGSDSVHPTPFTPRRPIAPGPALAINNEPRLEPAWLLESVPLPEQRSGPAFVYVCSGAEPPFPASVPIQELDLSRVSADLAACYALFRMYLFDYRAGFTLPLLLLIDDAGRAHKIYPELPHADVMRADLRQLNSGDRARLALSFSGRFYTPYSRNYFRLGAAFYWAGYPEQSLIYFDECVRRIPENAKAHLAIGRIHLEAARYDKAREHLERAAALSPDSIDCWTNLGSLEAAVGNHAAALHDFEKALAIVPDSVFALTGAGREQGKLGEFAKAEQYLERALEIDPRDAEAANQLGLIYAAQDRLEEAARCFERSIASDRAHAGAINNLGVVYMRMQKPHEAIAAFRYGIQVAPDEEMFYLNLARAYVATGDRSKARDVLDQLLQRRPDSASARKGLAELSNQ
jgi:tetratricopeptide (TPR) repeat protein